MWVHSHQLISSMHILQVILKGDLHPTETDHSPLINVFMLRICKTDSVDILEDLSLFKPQCLGPL
jgi:hypothetical protein